ncbi:MAG: hypothetical protein JSU82_12855 [Rhodospirillales bacterium]|nr:MAG: hypothetical protein JSU82_12855 [Rhodospirillales bacterium]
MTDEKRQHEPYVVAPVFAVATIPAEFIASAIFEVIQGARHLGENLGRAAGRLRRR